MPKTKKQVMRLARSKKQGTHAREGSILILFPNQLFAIPVLESLLSGSGQASGGFRVILIEHPLYYERVADNVKFSQVKLVYHRATVRCYVDYLRDKGVACSVVAVDECLAMRNIISTVIRKHSNGDDKNGAKFSYIDPVDSALTDEIAKCSELTRLESPLFMLSSSDLTEYEKSHKTNGRLMHSVFYAWHRDKLGILAGSRTYDTENRSRMPVGMDVPELPKVKTGGEYIAEAVKYIKGHSKWSKHPGAEHLANQIFPLTHEESRRWLDRFLAERFALFGKYQDSIVVSDEGEPQNFLFHSCISPMLNIGLLTPCEVIDRVVEYRKAHTEKVPMAAYEGFIRQIIGWREYQRYIYITIGPKIRKMNHFGNKRRLTQAWYDGTTGIQPVDDAIKMGFRDGYLHHILRLMVVGNFMNLVGIHPDDAYRWFMEFALDAYDWVMVGNVYSMAMWADGGMTMRKPYISSSKYILDMSNYSTKGSEWPEKWNAVYHHFIDRNGDALLKTYHAGIVRALRRKITSAEVKTELALAKRVIESISA